MLESLPGTDVKADMAESAVYINIPQAYLEYSAENWDPPSRWEEGIPGVLLDYNMNAQVSQQKETVPAPVIPPGATGWPGELIRMAFAGRLANAPGQTLWGGGNQRI